jgi:spermidine synthase
MPSTQKHFIDKVIDSKKTTFAEAQIVEWKDDFWLHYGGKLQFSTLDKHILAEAAALPALYLKPEPSNVLIIGGDNHVIIDQLNQSPKVNSISIIPFDDKYFDFVLKNGAILEMNSDSKIIESKKTLNHFITDSAVFDIIYIDQEVSNDVLIDFIKEIGQLPYSEVIIAFKSGNPYLQAKQFKERKNLITDLAYEVLPYHTQVPTMGQLSWILASKSMTQNEMRNKLLDLPKNTQGIWWNQQAMKMMLAFGKTDYFIRDNIRSD